MSVLWLTECVQNGRGFFSRLHQWRHLTSWETICNAFLFSRPLSLMGKLEGIFSVSSRETSRRCNKRLWMQSNITQSQAPKNVTHFYTIHTWSLGKTSTLCFKKLERQPSAIRNVLQPILLYCALGFWLFERNNIRKTLFCMSFLWNWNKWVL